jgi:hypothetical protein
MMKPGKHQMPNTIVYILGFKVSGDTCCTLYSNDQETKH